MKTRQLDACRVKRAVRRSDRLSEAFRITLFRGEGGTPDGRLGINPSVHQEKERRWAGDDRE